jgi:hypothetical protein
MIKCDFCSTPLNGDKDTKSYGCRTFTPSFGGILVNADTGEALIQEMVEHWAACQTCAILVDTENWNALLERSVKAFHESDPHFNLLPDEIARAMIKQLHQDFKVNRTGEA